MVSLPAQEESRQCESWPRAEQIAEPVDPDHYLAVLCDDYGNIVGWSRAAGQLFGLLPNEYSPASRSNPTLSTLLAGAALPPGFPGESAPAERLLRLRSASGEGVEVLVLCVPLEGDDSGSSAPGGRRHLLRFRPQGTVRRRLAPRESEVFDRFMPHLVHDLRSPVSAIVSFAATLRMGLAGPLTADQRRQLAIIETCAEQAMAFLGDLPEVLRIELGLFDVTSGPTSGRALLESLLDTGLRDADRARVAISLPTADVKTVADPNLVGLILSRLVSYAARRAPEGVVAVSCEPSPATGPAAIRFLVVDPGAPMGPDEVERAFRPFSRAAGDDHLAASPDLGLELHQSRLLATAIGGNISMYMSEDGKNILSLIVPGR